MSIGINKFVLRQTRHMPYAHYEGTWEELQKLVEENFSRAIQGYKPGVALVPVPPERFWSSTVVVTPDTQLRAVLARRRDFEEPYLDVRAMGEKSPAKHVIVILYSKEVLGDEATTDSEWEIISINARTTDEEEPMDPVTMARNFLELPGGTKGDFTAEQFARSIVYWSRRAKIDV